MANPWEKDEVVRGYAPEDVARRKATQPQVTSPGQPGLGQRVMSGLGSALQSRGLGQAIPETVGGTIGGFLGAPLGPLGAAAGVGLGGMLGHQYESLVARGRGREPRTPTQSALDSVTAGGIESGAGVLGQGAGAAARYVGGKLVKRPFSGGTPEAAEGLRTMQNVGAPLSIGPVTGGAGSQQIQEGMAQMLGASGVLKDVAEGTNKAMFEKARKAATRGKEMGESPFLAGEVAKKGLEAGKRAFNIKQKQMLSEVERFIPKGTKVDVNHFAEALYNPSQKFAGTPYEGFAKEAIDSPVFRTWKKELEKGAIKDADGNVIGYEPMTWEQIKEIRSALGRRKGQSPLTKDVSDAQLDMLYGSLSEDMSNAALKVGGKPAQDAFKNYNSYYSGGIKQIRDFVDKKLAMDSERLFESIDRGTVTDINKIKSFMPAENWEEVRAEVVRKMGFAGKRTDAGSDEFNPLVYLRRWQELSPEKKQALFGQYRKAPGIVDDLDTVAKAAERIKDMKSFTNPSRTSGNTWTMFLIGGMIGGAGGGYFSEDVGVGESVGALAGGAAMSSKIASGSYLIAKAISNPKFVKWLARADRFDVKTNGFANHVGRLAAMGFDPEVEEVKNSIVNTYETLSDNWDIKGKLTSKQ